MSYSTQTIDPIADDRWQSFVARSDNATIFHHSDWLQLLHQQYRYPMLARCVLDSEGQIVAGLPFAYVASRLTGKRVVALPFSDLCPVASAGPDSDEALELLAATVQSEHVRTGLDAEIRAPLAGIGTAGKSFYHHVVALDDGLEAVTARFKKNQRRDVTRAGREGIAVRPGTSVSDLDSFYRLHLATRKRQGVPTQPRSFIRSFARLFDRGLGFVLLATFEGQPVAGAVYLQWGKTLVYKYGASSPSFLKKRPNHAIFMESIRLSCEQGLQALDFGRTDLDNEGLRSFKLGWGATERELAYVTLSRRRRHSGDGVPGFAKTLITRTPAITGRLAGVALYRHYG